MTKSQFDFLLSKAEKLMQQTKDPIHDWSHCQRTIDNVFKIKKLLPLAEQKKLDDKILTLAAAWHDIAFVYYKPTLINLFFREGIRAARVTRRYCQQAGLKDKETDLMCDIVRHHIGSSWGDLNRRRGLSLYHQMVQDADTLESYASPIRLKQSQELAKKSHWYDWYGFINKILKPIFFKFFKKNPWLIYNLPHIIKRLIK